MASEDHKEKERASFCKSLSSMFKSPAAKRYDRSEKQHISDKERAKALVAQRDAQSPGGHFVLGYVKPLSIVMGTLLPAAVSASQG
ncbi:uncharacterized protein J7T54_004327 [Emericellopsis cladophorae]|uniref:Uncharacterized protein n=1 Tax=Emericellopsis cladophorae TaxID=2686198 RepID=A0A9P9Y5B4_9HYPO|nr:uncharacterized protein J7T54_004327 [Emericellopsis cladophorae]KAI6783300.1 hypothetical protein J7T54_004327 [Emericellopsis cladophorae]